MQGWSAADCKVGVRTDERLSESRRTVDTAHLALSEQACYDSPMNIAEQCYRTLARLATRRGPRSEERRNQGLSTVTFLLKLAHLVFNPYSFHLNSRNFSKLAQLRKVTECYGM